MNRRMLIGAVSALALGALGSLGLTPGASAGGRVHLDFAPGDMSVAIVGTGKGAVEWYLPYTLKNPMENAQRPGIRLELRTETKKTFGDALDARVIRAAEKATGKTGIKATSELRSEDLAAGAAAEAVANFGTIDPDADELTVRVYGLWDPVVHTKHNKVVKETRVLVLKYSRPGDEYDRQDDPIKFLSRTEEVEGEVVELYSTVPEKK